MLIFCGTHVWQQCNASYEDSFITCQITPNHHGSLLDSLVNIQLASWNPFSRQLVADWALFLQDLLGHPPSKCTLTFARSFAELSRNFRENIPIRQQGCASGWGEASPLATIHMSYGKFRLSQ